MTQHCASRLRRWILSDSGRSIIAGTCGSILQSALMGLKSALGLLPYFQPAAQIQNFLHAQFGAWLPPAALWILSFLNAAILVGFLFGHSYRFLPGRNALAKGLVFGLAVWAGVNAVLFPILGWGLFALRFGHGAEPALFMLAMMLTYSISFSFVFARIAPQRLLTRAG